MCFPYKYIVDKAIKIMPTGPSKAMMCNITQNNYSPFKICFNFKTIPKKHESVFGFSSQKTALARWTIKHFHMHLMN